MTRQLGGSSRRSQPVTWFQLAKVRLTSLRPVKRSESMSREGCRAEAWCGLQRRHAKAGSLLLIPHWTRAFDF